MHTISRGNEMTTTDIDDTVKQLSNLHIASTNKSKSIPFRKFREIRPDWNAFPKRLEPFFQESKEVALYSKKRLFTGINRWDASNIAVLNDDIAQLADKTSTLDCKPLIEPYLYYDLFEAYNGTIPLMDVDELNTPLPCLEYIIDWENTQRENGSPKEYGHDYKYVIVSARHHVNDLTMTLFDLKRPINYKLNCVLVKGKYIVLSMDEAAKNKSIDYSKMSLVDLKRCNSGFVFEDLLTSRLDKNSEESQPVFSIVENVVNDGVLLLLRSEMDAYNKNTKSYSELKCYGTLSMGNTYHRLKLLKTWVQTQLVPNCDVIIGIRDAYSGTLIDINEYTQDQLYAKLNNPDSHLSRNFNLTVARAWTRHCLESIIKLVELSAVKDEEAGKVIQDPQPFQISIDDKRNITISKLNHIPANLDIPEVFL